MKLYISGYGKMGRMIEKIILDRGLEYAGWSEAVTETDTERRKESHQQTLQEWQNKKVGVDEG